jgi:putative hydrolase of HD superfamily
MLTGCYSQAMNERLARQVDFILELDKLKSVLRRSYLVHADRRENSAEHSWHVAMLATVLCEHADEPVEVGHVIELMLVHDIVEIDAGDTLVYDTAAREDKAMRERQAAKRIFGLLPEEQGRRLHALWLEYEHGDSAEVRFARTLDRLMPLLHNLHTEGRSWREHGIRKHQVLEYNAHMEQGSTTLWAYVRQRIEQAAEQGHLPA